MQSDAAFTSYNQPSGRSAASQLKDRRSTSLRRHKYTHDSNFKVMYVSEGLVAI